MTQRNPAADKELQLIQQVFATPAGKELLELWAKYHVMSGIGHENPVAMSYRVGKAEFVIAILNCLEGG